MGKSISQKGAVAVSKVALVGPAILEFGWNLMTFNPHARAVCKGKYDRVVVVCRKGEEYIWEDFATDFEYVKASYRADRWFRGEGRACVIDKQIIKRWKGARIITPSQKTCTSRIRHYHPFGKVNTSLQYDLVIHARATQKYGQGDRNHKPEFYRKLLSLLPSVKACSIGTDAHLILGTDDKRGLPLRELCDLLRSSKLMIGPSSGPCHLSNLCGCPLVVWTYAKFEKAVKATNKVRYTKLWRPFDVPVKVIHKYGWKPPADVVAEKVRKMLCE